MASQPVAVITGAGSGIGRALSSALSETGHRLVLVDIDRTAVESVGDELGADDVRVLDVGAPQELMLLASSLDRCDLLALNAGVLGASLGPPWEATPADWRHVLDVNLGGAVNGLRAFLPLMSAQAFESSILITASLAGALTFPGGGPYGASKHAVLALAEQAALTLGVSPVTVTVTCPALVRTRMSDDGVDPDLVAARALDAVREKRFAVVDPDWHAAVLERAEMLVSGRQPTPPTPA